MIKYPLGFTVLLLLAFSTIVSAGSGEARLERVSYASEVTGLDREYFVYLPANYSEQEQWPVLMFLHGNGERGDGQGELDYVLCHGPIYEAWIQKRDLPFVIIAPQLPMFGQGEVDYIRNRTPEGIPVRLLEGVPARPAGFDRGHIMQGQLAERSPYPADGLPEGWPLIEDELLGMLDHVIAEFRGNPQQVYLTGLSYGGYGTWHLGAKFPERFAAIAPVVGHGHLEHAAPIATAGLPIWQFAGGKDSIVPVKHFYDPLNELQRLGHPEVRFTIEADQGHSAWVRVYAGEGLYQWFLSHALPR